MIHSIWVKSFRCLNENLISFDDSPFLSVVSENNVGKTSLLEACYILGNLQSFTTKSLSDIVPFDQKSSYMGIKLAHHHSSTNYYLKVDSEGKKFITLNNHPVRNKKAIQSLFRVHYISSDSLFFITSSPAFRRARLDHSISQYSATYRSNLAAYKRLNLQKNKTLKFDGDRSLLSHLNQLLAPLIVAIQDERTRYLSRIESDMNIFLASLSIPVNQVNIRYYSKLQPQKSASDVLLYLNDQMARERLIRSATVGPHRDDYEFFCKDRSLKLFYSRGMGRVIAYFFQLSQARVIQNVTELPLLLLLDEPFSEIHRDLKCALINGIPESFYGIYVSTQPDEVTALNQTPLYAIKNGKLCKH
jgi:DNA replication and repair protein RecF